MNYIAIVELYHRCGLVGIKLCASSIEVNDGLLIALYRLDPAIIPLLSIEPVIWVDGIVGVLGEIGLMEMCPINQLADWMWVSLLLNCPNLLCWFDSRLATLATVHWPAILNLYPQLVDDPRVPYDAMSTFEWRRLVSGNIIFHSRCDWHIFDADDWLRLFKSQYAPACREQWWTLPMNLRDRLTVGNPRLREVSRQI